MKPYLTQTLRLTLIPSKPSSAYFYRSMNISSYCIVRNFGGKKLWQIWRSAKVFLPIFTAFIIEQDITKILNLKKEVGIAIKSKKTSS